MANEHPPTHCIVFGESGTGKSTFISTWPKPLLVFNFDPLNKEAPYLRRGNVEMDADAQGTPLARVMSRNTNKLIVQVEYYLDGDPHKPEAYQRFLKRLNKLTGEYEQWKTIAADSATYLELIARKLSQYHLNPTSKDPRQWYAASTEQLEEVLMMRFGSLPMNVVLACHVDEDKDNVHGNFVRNPAAPGRMRKRLASGFSELYHSYVTRDENNNVQYLLQTVGDQQWNATSSFIQAPNPCEPTYQALWAEETVEA